MPEDVERLLGVVRKVCAGVALIVPLLGYVTWTTVSDGTPSALEPSYPIVFCVLGLANIAVGPFLRSWLLRRAADGRFVPEERLKDVVDGTVPDTRANRLSGLQSAVIVGYAMGEIAVMFGFVLSFMSESWPPFLVGAAISIAYWIAMFPRRAQWTAWAEEAGLMTPLRMPAHEPPRPL